MSQGVIGDFFNVKGGKRLPKGSKFSLIKTDYPYLRVTDFSRNGLNISNIKYIDKEIYEKIKRYIITPNEVYISIAGTIGVAGIVPQIFSGANLTENAAKLIPKDGVEIIPKYVSYFLNSEMVQRIIKSKTMAVGVPKLALFRIQEIPINLPPLAEQKKIAAILDEADQLRRLNQSLLEKYDALSQSLFLDMFGDTWLNPQKWEIKLVEEIAEDKKHSIKAGPFGSSLKKEFYVKEGYKIYGQEQVIKDDFNFGDYYIDEKRYKSLESCKIQTGDILISLVGTYGKISIVPTNFEPGIINPRLMKISPNDKVINSIFLKKVLQSSGVSVQLKNRSRGGTMDIINVGIIRKIKIPLPPLSLQIQFVERLKKIEAQKAQAQASLEKSEALFNSLLQRAFKGELV